MKHLKPYIFALVAMGLFMSAKNAETNTFKFNQEGLWGEWQLDAYQEVGAVKVQGFEVGNYNSESFNEKGSIEFTSSGAINHAIGYELKTELNMNGNVVTETSSVNSAAFKGSYRFQETDSFLMIQT